jgi:urease gamma subunit
MPIRPFLEGQFFDPELIEAMSKALVAACLHLGLKPKDDAATRLLAMRIIEQAREGVHDAELLQAAALKGLGPALRH